MGDGRDAVDEEGAGQRADRVEALAGQVDRADEPAQRETTERCRPRRRRSSAATNSPHAVPDGAAHRRPSAQPAARPSARCRPGRWRRTRPPAAVPARPPTSLPPSTEKTTAGSVGASAVPSSIDSNQPMPNARCATAADADRGHRGAGDAEPQHRSGRPAEPAPADVHAAVEEDDHQCDGDQIARPFESGCRTRSAPAAAATAAPMRKMAGAGTRRNRLIRLDSTAIRNAAAQTQTMSPNCVMSAIGTPYPAEVP